MPRMLFKTILSEANLHGLEVGETWAKNIINQEVDSIHDMHTIETFETSVDLVSGKMKHDISERGILHNVQKITRVDIKSDDDLYQLIPRFLDGRNITQFDQT